MASVSEQADRRVDGTRSGHEAVRRMPLVLRRDFQLVYVRYFQDATQMEFDCSVSQVDDEASTHASVRSMCDKFGIDH
jgi:hypothetical protein